MIDYFERSEQIPTALHFDSLITEESSPDNEKFLKVHYSFGVIAQALPETPKEVVQEMQQKLDSLNDRKAELIEMAKRAEEIAQIKDVKLRDEAERKSTSIGEFVARHVLPPLEQETVRRTPLDFFCRCSEKDFIHSISTMDSIAIEGLLQDAEDLALTCEFCKNTYSVTTKTLQILLDQAKSRELQKQEGEVKGEQKQEEETGKEAQN